eukprot:363999-Chlamydomonas_euryale.AAC.11
MPLIVDGLSRRSLTSCRVNHVAKAHPYSDTKVDSPTPTCQAPGGQTLQHAREKYVRRNPLTLSPESAPCSTLAKSSSAPEVCRQRACPAGSIRASAETGRVSKSVWKGRKVW